MSRKTELAELSFSNEQYQSLIKIAQSRISPIRELQRARTLLQYKDGVSITGISSSLNINRKTVYKYINKAITMGIEEALKDKYHRPKDPVITEDAKTWVINLACTKPKEHGYASEVWSLDLLAKHTRKHAPRAGYKYLSNAAKATIHRILKSHPVKPHKIQYYLERRDPEFDKKMNEVLIVYKEVNLQNESSSRKKNLSIITISVDEKPGVQAIGNIAPDLPPVPGKHTCIGRDHEYERLGTVSILASLDLHTGHVIGQVHDRHRSREFISLLKEIDSFYPKKCQIRIILDNHSSHISEETMKYLSGKPNRFVYVHTPKHGSWLNLAETLFGKMARTFLKSIRVNSVKELKNRILKGVNEINQAPVVHRWKNFDFAG